MTCESLSVMEEKVWFTLEQATTAQRGRRYVAVPFL